MVVVAIAGGFGGVGTQFSQAIRDSGKHEVVILKRKGSYSKDLPNFEVAEIDYADVPAMTAFLNKRGVHTVVSALGVHWEEASNFQINLVRAADDSSSVKRFLPAEFTFPYNPTHDLKPFYCKAFTDANRAVLAKTKLEWTILYCGQFMDYFGLPNIPTTVFPLYLLIDLPSKTANIPGDGSATLSVILTNELGLFVAAMLDLPKWDSIYNAYGDILTLHELVDISERVAGTKFNVIYESVDTLVNGRPEMLPSNEPIYSSYELAKEDAIQFSAAISVGVAQGAGNVSVVGTSLNKLFPGIKTTKTEEYMKACYTKTE